MLTQHNRKTCRLSPDYTLVIRELGVWSGDETRARGNTVTTVTASEGARPVVMEGNRAGRGSAGGISTTPLVLSVDGRGGSR